jgi:DNA ligase-1
VPRRVTTEPGEVADFFAETVATGHEGLVIKDLDAPYEAGRRGAAWVKVKPRHTLDLVVLAVEQGSGRRQGWLSNIHLGARDPATGDFVMLGKTLRKDDRSGWVPVGKTFKGMTDEILAWQTKRFRELQVSDNGWIVTVRPEQVVEIAFDGVQRSSRYPGGVALRFARVLRYRHDKSADEADTIDTVRSYLDT